MISKEASLLLFLVDYKIRTLVFESLEYEYFAIDAEAGALYKAFARLQDTDHTTPLVLEQLLRENVTGEQLMEIKQALLGLPRQLSDHNREVILESFEDMIRLKRFERALTNVNQTGIKDSGALREFARIDEFSILTQRLLDFTKPETLAEAKKRGQPTTVIPSSIAGINQTSLFNGYFPGQLVLVCAAPGIGKSTFLITEGVSALQHGFKVLSIYLGDLVDFDIYCRYAANITQKNITGIAMDPDSVLAEISPCMENFRASCHSGDELTAEDVLAKCRSIKDTFPFDMILIDYDGNLKAINDASALYAEGGLAYSIFDRIAKSLDCVVIVASQTKQAFWNDELVPREAADESSKKQHAVDLMLGLGRNQKNPSLGTLHIAKNRRGEDGKKCRIAFQYTVCNIVHTTEEYYQQQISLSK